MVGLNATCLDAPAFHSPLDYAQLLKLIYEDLSNCLAAFSRWEAEMLQAGISSIRDECLQSLHCPDEMLSDPKLR